MFKFPGGKIRIVRHASNFRDLLVHKSTTNESIKVYKSLLHGRTIGKKGESTFPSAHSQLEAKFLTSFCCGNQGTRTLSHLKHGEAAKEINHTDLKEPKKCCSPTSPVPLLASGTFCFTHSEWYSFKQRGQKICDKNGGKSSHLLNSPSRFMTEKCGYRTAHTISP